jgi:V/A-type H+-transporting ATPase subunit I
MDALEKRIEADKTAIAARKDIRMNLKVCADRLTQDQQREQYKEKLLRTEKTFFLEGWVTAPDIPKLEAVLETYACAWELEEPAEEQYPEVPVKLKNGPLTRPLNMVTEMYSLPAYGSLDPNPLMAPFFILFYGIMMADMGYGILMMLASYIIMKKSKPNGATMRYMIPLLGLCGASTFVMGFLTGGFFGDFIPQIAKLINPNSTLELWSLFSPLDDALMVLIGSLALGLVQIFVGMGVNMYKQIKRGQVMAALCNEGAWYLIFVCIGVGIAVGQIKVGLIAALVIIVLTQGYGKKGIGGKLMGIGGSLYNNITGYFSDILSYSRLMALMLAGAVIAQVFNTLGAITGNVITFVLISMIGNALNFALNLLGCFVHDMRLQCLEFFSRFYEDGGKAFRPLEVATTYVDITQE